MTYGREKRLLLGVAAAVAPLPLPLNEMLEWTALALYLLAIALFLRHAASPATGERWLSKRTLNLLGLVYLPLLVLDVGATGRAQLLRPMLHLTLFVVAVKLWSITEEKHKWQAWIGIFFLFLASMATSVHPAVVLFLAFFVALTVVVLLRFVYLHALAAFGHRDGSPPRLPVRGFATATVIATLALAVPLFALLPRVRAPYIMGPGGSGQGELARAGFSDEMSLDLIGRIRDNQQVAMRLAFTGRTAPPGAMRFKAATYDIWQGRRWRRSERSRALLRDPREALFRLAAGRPQGSATIYLEPLRSTSLIVPMESLTIDLPLAALDVDAGGALALRGMPDEILEYRVTLAGRELSLADPPRAEARTGVPSDELDPSGITPRIAALAAGWAGEGSTLDRARRIERHLLSEYGYTLDFIGRSAGGSDSQLEYFLFDARRGHCEYFASSMVLLLRSQGIPARLVTGFLGAEYSSWERAWLVRQSNAHAWVEGWVGEGDGGWIAFDPTPPAGRPQIEPEDAFTLARQAWEFVTFRWDRYVISFDFYDQVGMIFNMRSLWDRLMREIRDATSRRPAAVASADTPEAPGAAVAPAPPGPSRNRFVFWAGLVAVAGAATGLFLLLRQRGDRSRTRVYRALVATLRGSGLAVPEWAGPLHVADLAGNRFPAAAPASLRIVRGYIEESFGGEPTGEAELAGARRDLAEVEAAIRATVKDSRRSRKRGSGRSPEKTRAAGGKRA